ncbi:hypothetical protein D7X33_19580 [Butyricicoccus sp. 1XD8-22]|nr:hypothetical protein D7X33_19580 [Butyricicoccus sp. 1XD8-22]
MDTELKELEKMKLLRRRRERNEREEQRKENNHWCFVAGTLVSTYLKTDLGITVYKGKDATSKNKVSFAPLENILAYLADHKEFTARIAAGIRDPPGSP